MGETIQAWQCIGCGRIEAPRTCVGVCQDRKVELVPRDDLDIALREAEQLRHRVEALRMLLTRFTRATPREGGWAASWHQLQALASQALAADACWSPRSEPARGPHAGPDGPA